MIRRMLVADDGSQGGENAFASALELARRLGVGLAMVCVEEAPRFPASIDEVTEALSDHGGVFDKVVAAAKAQAAARTSRFSRMSSSGILCRRSSNSSSAAATICWSSATWATRRCTIASSAGRPIGWSS